MKKIFIAAYHQSKFGKLFDLSIAETISRAVTEVCAEINSDAAQMDVASIAATCTVPLSQQGLVSGLMAMVPGLAAKPIETVENACASGGQAVVSVIQKLQLGQGEVGIAVGIVVGAAVGVLLRAASEPKS